MICQRLLAFKVQASKNWSVTQPLHGRSHVHCTVHRPLGYIICLWVSWCYYCEAWFLAACLISVNWFSFEHPSMVTLMPMSACQINFIWFSLGCQIYVTWLSLGCQISVSKLKNVYLASCTNLFELQLCFITAILPHIFF